MSRRQSFTRNNRRGGRGGGRDQRSRPESSSDRMDQLMAMMHDLQSKVNALSSSNSKKRSHSPASSSTERKTLKRSSNPDFTILTKELFKNGLLSKAQKNWKETPMFLEKGACKLVNSIRVPNSNPHLEGRLITLAKDFARRITKEVSQFLDEELEENQKRIHALDETDFDLAVDIAGKYLAKRNNSDRPHTELTTSGKSVTFADLKRGRKHSPTRQHGLSNSLGNKSDNQSHVNQLSDKLTSVKLGTETTPKGKRKSNVFSPDDTTAVEQTATVDDSTCVISDVETGDDVTQKPAEKRTRPSNAYLQKSPGVYVYTGAKDAWTIQPSDPKNVVVLADSNMRLAQIPTGYEFFVLPGAQLKHATDALRRWEEEKGSGQFTVALQIGINNRAKHPDALDVDIKQLSDVVKKNPHIIRFIYMGVSYPDTLPQVEQQNLSHLNQRMLDRWGENNFIETLDPQSVEIDPGDSYGIHYTGTVRQLIIDRLVQHVTGQRL